MLAPCSCSGSLRFIHEECLKCWIQAKHPNLSTAECEICKTPFVMKYTIKRQFSVRDTAQRGRSHQVFFYALLVVLTLLGVAVFIISNELAKREQSFIVIFLLSSCLVVLGIAALAITVLLLKTCHELFWVRRMTNWTISSQTGGRARERTAALSPVHPPLRLEPNNWVADNENAANVS